MPMMAMVAGRSCCSNRVSVVRIFSPNFSTQAAGTTGFEPVAMTKAFALMRSPFTSTASGATKRAAPRTSLPRFSSCSALPAGPEAKPSRILRTWASTAGMSAITPSPPDMPSFAKPWRACQRSSAAWMSTFEGIQPTRAQVVPSGPGSMTRKSLALRATCPVA